MIDKLRNQVANTIWGQLEKLEPQFLPGGKFEKLHSVWDGNKTFLFAPPTTTQGKVHVKDGMDLKRTMIHVILAMVPALLFGIYNVGQLHYTSFGEEFTFFEAFGYGLLKVIPIVVVAYATGLAIEFAVAQAKGHQIHEGFLVSGMLIPLVMPPDIPLWMVALGTAFAVILAKEVFGGTGMNVLNVALTARVFIFFAYPSYISGDQVWISEMADGYSGATVLAQAAAGNEFTYSFADMFFGFIPGSIGETSTLLILLGAAFLIVTGVGSWRIILSVFAGAGLMGLLCNAIGANHFMEVPFYYHWVMGGLAFGAVYMATDPVTASQTPKGKVIYGLLIGAFAVLIRVFNPAYPEGIMLSILLFNVFAPLIDYYVVQANVKKRLARVAQ
jgi:Na+-transporting NADH:ubiquinone oxidoreductase subunit B